MERIGLIHIYCGDGKGKTTAACGLAIRAAGQGLRVLFVQFFKKPVSGEINSMAKIDGVTALHANCKVGRFSKMTEEERNGAKSEYGLLLYKVFGLCENGGADVLVLDEAVSACNRGIIDKEVLNGFLSNKPKKLEVVLTGRNPSAELVAAADYVSEIKKIKHPFDRGIKARKGIEF